MSKDSSFLPQRIFISRGAFDFDDSMISSNLLVLSCSFASTKVRARFHVHASVTEQGTNIDISDDLLALGVSSYQYGKSGVGLKIPRLGLCVNFPLLNWFDFEFSALLLSQEACASTFLIPFQGVLQKQYFDGPICHLDEGGRLRSYIPPASKLALEVPMEVVNKRSLASETLAHHLKKSDVISHNIRRSLAAAIRAQLPNKLASSYRVLIPAFTLENSVLLVGLRVALGDRLLSTNLEEHALDDSVQLPAWRRLCQHLNIFFGKNASCVSSEADIDLGALRHLIQDGQASEIVTALNHFGMLLPKRIISASMP